MQPSPGCAPKAWTPAMARRARGYGYHQNEARPEMRLAALGGRDRALHELKMQEERYEGAIQRRYTVVRLGHEAILSPAWSSEGTRGASGCWGGVKITPVNYPGSGVP